MTYARRSLLGLLATLAAAAGVPGATAADAPKYNVLMIALDDLRPQLGCFGHPEIKTPNMDKLAAGGTVFRRAYCQQAVCSPSRTSLLTGLRPDTTRIYNLQTHFRKHLPDAVTLPQSFKQHGYHTQALGKIFHNGLDDPQSWSVKSWRPGGKRYLKPESNAIVDALRAEIKAAGGDDSRKGVPIETDPKTGTVLELSKGYPSANGPAWEDPDCADNELSDGKTADRAIDVLREIKDKPFFLAVGFAKPHLPFVAPKRYYDLYPPESIKLADNPYPPKDAPKEALAGSGELRSYAGIPKKGPVSEQQARELVRGYYAATSYADAQIGRVLDELQKLGLADKTIVVLWGDHGWKLGDHGEWCKHTNFENDANAPLIVRVPGQHPARHKTTLNDRILSTEDGVLVNGVLTITGNKSDALVEFVDVYPTLCELCNVPRPKDLEGTSMVPLLEAPNRRWKSAAFNQYPRGKATGHSLRTDRYRYTEWAEPGSAPTAVELYDHEKDPQENVNVASLPENRELVSQLSKQLQTGWRGALPPK